MIYIIKKGSRCYEVNPLVNEELKEVDWNVNDGILEDLSVIELYDKACADVYVNEENERSTIKKCVNR